MLRLTPQKSKRCYKILIITFLVLDYVIFFLNSSLNNLKFLDTLRLTAALLIAIMYMLRVFLNKYIFSTWLKISAILVLTLLAWKFHLNLIVKVMLLSLAMSLLSPQEIFKTVGISTTITVIIGAITSILGITPLWVNGHTLVLGFGYKNTLGLFLFTMSSYFIYIFNNNRIQKIIAYVVFIISFLIDWYLIGDRTIAISMLLLIIIKIMYIKREKATKMWACLPIILLMLSIFLSWKYTGSDLWNIIDNALSYRLRIWNYVWQHKSINLLPQDLTFNDIALGGIIFWGILPIDGFFALGSLVYGIIYFSILMIFLIYLLWKLVSKKELFGLFPYALCFVMTGFSELSAIGYTTSWLLPATVCIYLNAYTQKDHHKNK